MKTAVTSVIHYSQTPLEFAGTVLINFCQSKTSKFGSIDIEAGN